MEFEAELTEERAAANAAIDDAELLLLLLAVLVLLIDADWVEGVVDDDDVLKLLPSRD
jgi:hypothetical protein